MAAALRTAARTGGIVLFEPFGGLASGLQMCLANGIKVKRYLYCDTDQAAIRAAQHRLGILQQQYPRLLPRSALANTFTALPADVRSITADSLRSAGAAGGDLWFVVAGWPCQDFSDAGGGLGLKGPHSSLFFPLLRVLQELQRLQWRGPAFLLENAPLQLSRRHPHLLQDFEEICTALGCSPLCLDAAQFGSHAHRLRNFWTNLASPSHLRAVLKRVERPPGLHVNQVLHRGWSSKVRDTVERAPFYPCCVPGEPAAVLPTLMARHASWAYSRDGGGVLVSRSDPTQQRAPDSWERELILGFEHGSTAAPDLSEQQRCALLGRSMDQRCVNTVLAASLALARAGHAGVPAPPALCTVLGGGIDLDADADTDDAVVPSSEPGAALCSFPDGLTWLEPAPYNPETEPEENMASVLDGPLIALCARVSDDDPTSAFPLTDTDPVLLSVVDQLAGADGATGDAAGARDIYQDQHCLQYLRDGMVSEPLDPVELKRVMRRANHYRMQGGQLWRVMPNGRLLRCPPPADRRAIVQQSHDLAHLGQKRVVSFLRQHYWWYGLTADVADVVSRCRLCDQANAAGQARPAELQPLPIKGPFYRWGIDLAGELPKTADGNCYVMVAIEHFSKHIELYSIPDKSAATTTRCLLDLICRYGAPAEIVTDQGTEFLGSFEQLLAKCFIDHRTTSSNHPAANGAAERIVQVVKRALRKHVQVEQALDLWDEWLPWLALGYRCSVQRSTGYTPYFMLYGVHPHVPPAVRERMDLPLDFDLAATKSGRDELAIIMQQRAAAIQEAVTAAWGNLEIAQHRDRARYERSRSGLYQSPYETFKVGHYVYLRRGTTRNTLQMPTQPEIYRIIELRPSGVALLRSRRGTLLEHHVEQLLMCHLPDVEPIPLEVPAPGASDSGLRRSSRQQQRAQRKAAAEAPAIAPAPSKRSRRRKDKKPADKKPKSAPAADDDSALLQSPLFTSKERHRQDQLARTYDGTEFYRAFETSAGSGVYQLCHGRVRFIGPRARPYYFKITYEDGDSETMDLEELQWVLNQQSEWLATIPKMRDVAAVLCSLRAVPHQQPWDLSTADGVLRALELLMPGQWPQKHASFLARRLPGGQAVDASQPLRHVPTLETEVTALLDCVDFRGCARVLDPWSGDGAVARVFNARGLPVTTNDLDSQRAATWHEDALQPGFYSAMRARLGRLDALVFSSWFTFLDLALPLAASAADVVACAHVPGHWLTDAPPPRQAWLRSLQSAGRLAIVTGLPRGPMGRRCLWVCVFKTAQLRKRMLRAAPPVPYVVFM